MSLNHLVNQKEVNQATLNIQKKQDVYVQKLTLAQRLGIVSKPDLPLGVSDWGQIEKKQE